MTDEPKEIAVPEADRKHFRSRLLRWYRRHKRSLPWRQNVTAYRVWISEVMLQQTRVDTAAPYFERFMAAFPDVRRLAGADLEQVLKLWEGLGYYSRARNLHRAARLILSQYGGAFPSRYEDVLNLPGVGPYTAAAICSIAFGQPYPVVDGNVARVLARYFDLEISATDGRGKKVYRKLAKALLAPRRPGEFNQALMELGAVVCVPGEPHCRGCPVRTGCRALRNGTQHLRPVRKKRPPAPHYTVAVGVIWRDGEILVTRRPEDGLLGGLWEFPGGKLEAGETLEECVQREIQEELGLHVAVRGKITVVRHAYSHFRITLHAFHCQYLAGTPHCSACTGFKWVPVAELNRLPFPRANKRVVEILQREISASQTGD